MEHVAAMWQAPATHPATHPTPSFISTFRLANPKCSGMYPKFQVALPRECLLVLLRSTAFFLYFPLQMKNREISIYPIYNLQCSGFCSAFANVAGFKRLPSTTPSTMGADP